MAPSASFTPDRLASALDAIGAEVGLDVRDANLLRLAANAVFHLPSAQVVVRIGAPGSLLPQVCRTVQVARWLGEIGFPAVRLHGDHEQPIVVGNYLATVWDYLPPSRVEPPPEALAWLLRELHPLIAPFPLPRWNPVADARQLLARGNGLEEVDRAFLDAWCDELESGLALLAPALPAGLVHGDAWQGNLLVRSGVPVLADFDQVSIGPREWDLVPTIVNALCFGSTHVLVGRFLDAYGFDVTVWHGFALLRKLRELVMLAGVAPVLSSSPTIAREFARRLDNLRNGRDERWVPYH